MSRDCNKDTHSTYRAAQKVIRTMERRDKLRGKTIRKQAIYKCPECGGIHTTSHSYDKQKRAA